VFYFFFLRRGCGCARLHRHMQEHHWPRHGPTRRGLRRPRPRICLLFVSTQAKCSPWLRSSRAVTGISSSGAPPPPPAEPPVPSPCLVVPLHSRPRPASRRAAVGPRRRS
jgi:hypothetical protein